MLADPNFVILHFFLCSFMGMIMSIVWILEVLQICTNIASHWRFVTVIRSLWSRLLVYGSCSGGISEVDICPFLVAFVRRLIYHFFVSIMKLSTNVCSISDYIILWSWKLAVSLCLVVLRRSFHLLNPMDRLDYGRHERQSEIRLHTH